ncbi:MAG: type III-A CRISPR-associated RAMP protein Csm5 [Spirochaetota bacterium]|jgi:CRISPR-associated protein Csm5|uniref:type III-A CRISPR-associated RAMP protein Csm5 n=1 Tax=Rectinema subterraneum TaxID=2653714 RepID=UPI00131D1F4F|nr:type III-A CRISPR-associated RAMP protein Csm5 [Rectinema subterraneum]
MKRYRFTLRPLTAVHVGTGDVLTPLEYSLLSSTSGGRLYAVFSPEKIVESLPKEEKQQFSQFCSSNNLIGLRKYLGEKVRMPAVLYACKVSKEFESEFDGRKDDINNALEVEIMYRNSKHAPVVPGSSIKGAIRTALLDKRASMMNRALLEEAAQEASRTKFDRKFQSRAMLFSAPNDDPLRALAIGDCTFSPKGSQLVSNMIMYHFSSRYDDPFSNKAAIFAEVLKGELIDGSPTEASCDLIIHDELFSAIVPPGSRALGSRGGQKLYQKPVRLEEMLEACDEFYNRAFDSEYNRMIKSSDEAVKIGADALADRIDCMQEKGEHLIRIGRWSHVESVTVEDYRKPKSDKGYGKTRTLLQYNDNYYLMGWCAFSVEKE